MEQYKPEALPPINTYFTPEQLALVAIVDAIDARVLRRLKEEEEKENE